MIADDIDDSLAANPPPGELTAHRRKPDPAKGDGRWGVVWIPGKPAEVATGRTCKRCGTHPFGGVLHADPVSTFPERVICGVCQGKASAERYGYAPGRVP